LEVFRRVLFRSRSCVSPKVGVTDEDRESVARLRRRGMTGLVQHGAKGDKQVRARSFIAPAAEAGDVRLPAYAEWLPLLLDELAGFPDASHDDQVDAMSQALQRLGHGGASLAAPQRSTPAPTPGRPTTTVGGGARAQAPSIQAVRRG
jgi:hypothetical protein